MAHGLEQVARFDDALPPALFESVSAMAAALAADLNPRGTFWQSLGGPAGTAIAAAALGLSRLVPDAGEYAGVEWWVRMRPADAAMAFHFDKDESRVRLTREIRHPHYSTVLYLTDAGGPTVIVDQSVSPDGELLPRDATEAVLSHPSRNGFLVFPGHLRHGVVAGESSGHGTASDRRTSLLMNWWQERPMLPGCREAPPEALIPWSGQAGEGLVRLSPLATIQVADLSDIAPV